MLLVNGDYDEEILCTLITESLENENNFMNCTMEDDEDNDWEHYDYDDEDDWNDGYCDWCEDEYFGEGEN